VAIKTHVPRLAWDTARAIIQASADPAASAAFADWLTAHAGPSHGRMLVETHRRLRAGAGFESVAVEAGLWRVRLDDLLHDHPDLTEPLTRLLRDTAGPGRARAA
jgi:hypothetical protein